MEHFLYFQRGKLLKNVPEFESIQRVYNPKVVSYLERIVSFAIWTFVALDQVGLRVSVKDLASKNKMVNLTDL